jgi:nucleoside-diphosphate-sugar epimerase
MRILITGGLGLIGHNVVKRLKDNHEILIVDTLTNYGIIPEDQMTYLFDQRLQKIETTRDSSNIRVVDIADRQGMHEIYKEFKPEIIMHLASFPRQKVVNANPQLGSKTMSEGLLNLCELSQEFKVKKFMYISSSMVYGEFTHCIKEDEPCYPEGQYGIMKLAGEWLVKDYARRNAFSYTIIRPSAVYGELDVEDRVISKFLLTAMRGGTLKVNGIKEVLDFTYVEDAADGIVAATLSENTHNKTYNITKSHTVSLYDAAEMAVKLAGKGNIEVRDKDADFPSRGALDISAARQDFGYDPKVDVQEGFQKYYQWLKNSSYWGD